MSDLLNSFGVSARKRGPAKGSTNKRTEENMSKMEVIAKGSKTAGGRIGFVVDTDSFGSSITTLRKVVKQYSDSNGYEFQSVEVNGNPGYLLSKDAPKRQARTRKAK